MSKDSRTSGVMINNAMQRSLQTFSVYDVHGRLSEYYEAPSECKHGSPCFLTQYKFEGETSVIIATKETVATWDSAMDFDALP